MPKTVACNDGCLISGLPLNGRVIRPYPLPTHSIRGLAVGLVRRYALMGWLAPLLKCAEDETGPPLQRLDEDRIRRVRFPPGWHG